MNTYTCLALVVAVFPVFGISLLLDSESQNTTHSIETVTEVKNMDVFRQVLNQETIIRMGIVKDIHVLIKDTLTLKQSLLYALATRTLDL
jgi:spore coat protein CotH